MSKAKTTGSKTFNPDDFFSKWARGEICAPSPETNDLRSMIVEAFGLKPDDDYVYHAVASVTLAQVQAAINRGPQNGLHAWYAHEHDVIDAVTSNSDNIQNQPNSSSPTPPQADITAYTQIFSPYTSTLRALTALSSNARKGSIRARVAANLLSKRHVPASCEVAKAKPAPSSTTASSSTSPSVQVRALTNPYLDVWTWSSHAISWAGPTEATENVKQSHHILPVLYHHFGCIVPSHDALMTIRDLSLGTSPLSASSKSTSNSNPDPTTTTKAVASKARASKTSSTPRTILDIGSGNGYWTYTLRRLRLPVVAIDDASSTWRTTWIPDTIRSDGAKYLSQHPDPLAILLLVYPPTSHDFFIRTVAAYQGDTVVVAGTQNGNAFTGVAGGGETVASVLEREGWLVVLQTPLPSFAGKDEALFVFVRRVAS